MPDNEKKSLPDLQKAVDDLSKKASRPLIGSPEEQKKQQEETTSETLSLSASMQAQLSAAEYSKLGFSQGTGQAGLMATANKLAQAAESIPGASLPGSPLSQMLTGYRQRQEANREGGIGGPSRGSGGGIGQYSGGAAGGYIGAAGGGGPIGGIGQYSGGAAGGYIGAAGGGGPISGATGGTAGAIYGSLDRSKFKAELANDPKLRQKVMAIAGNENNNPQAQQAVIESMMNRASMAGTSLRAQAKWVTEGGYYDDKHGGHSRGDRLAANAKNNGLDQRLESVLSGSNISNYATGNASGSFVERRIKQGLFPGGVRFKAGGETFVGEDRGQGWKNWHQQVYKAPEKGISPGGPSGGTSLAPGGKWGGVGEAQSDAARVSTGTGIIGGERKFSAAQLKDRPMQQRGGLHFEGFKDIDPKDTIHAASGTQGRLWSAPYGTYSLSPQSLASATRISGYYQQAGIPRTGPYSTVWNVGTPSTPSSTGYDPAAGRARGGIQIHAHPNDIAALHSAGCIVMQAKDIPAFQEKMKKAQAQGGAVIEVTPEGYRIIPAHQSKNAITAAQAIENKKTTGTVSGQGTPEEKRKEWPGEKEYQGPQKGLDAERTSTETPFGAARSSSIKTELGGTAFSIGDGHFITASHYLGGDKKSINLGRGDTLIHAEVLHRNPDMDYALLKTSKADAERLTEAGLTTSQLAKEPSKIGETLTMQGFSGRSDEYTTAQGKILSREDVPIQYPTGGKVTATAKDAYLMEPSDRDIAQRMPGTSGGPVTDESGQVQGLVSGGGQGPEGLRMFSTPMHRIIEDIPKELRQNIPQLRERLREQMMKERMATETPEKKIWPEEKPGQEAQERAKKKETIIQEGLKKREQEQTPERKIWPGEKPSATKESKKNLPLLEGADGKPARGQPSQKDASGKPAPQAIRAAEQARGAKKLMPGKDLSGVNPELRGRLQAAYNAAPASAKAGFQVLSGRRSTELQAKLYKRFKAGVGGIAAAPGHSQHEHGMAIDIRDPSGWFHKHGKEFGIYAPMGKKDWPHFQLDPSYKGQPHATAGGKPQLGEEKDTRTHEVKKAALRERTSHEKPEGKPQHRMDPHHQKGPPHTAIHHPQQERQKETWAKNHAKPSSSTQSRVQHSHRTRHAVDESFHESSNPNAA